MPTIDDHNYAQPSTSPENSNTPVESRPTRSNSDLQFLINELLDNQSKKPNDALSFNSLKSALTFLNSKLGEERFRLRVQPSFALEDAFSYLKGNDFDPTHVLVTTFKGQPAIDTGGVLRQFYTDCFQQMIVGCDLPAIFEGCDNRKLPVHNTGIVLSGLMELAGKLMAHSIIQAGICVNHLAPYVYHYLSSGDLAASMEYVTIQDSPNHLVKHYISKVSFFSEYS